MRTVKTNDEIGDILVSECSMCDSDTIEFVPTINNSGYWICDDCFFTFPIDNERIAPGIGAILEEKNYF